MWGDPSLNLIPTPVPALSLSTSGSLPSVSYNGSNTTWSNWNRWTNAVIAFRGGYSEPDLVAAEALGGRELALAIAMTSQTGLWMVDNVRVFNMVNSANPAKAPKAAAKAPVQRVKPGPNLWVRPASLE